MNIYFQCLPFTEAVRCDLFHGFKKAILLSQTLYYYYYHHHHFDDCNVKKSFLCKTFCNCDSKEDK